jgi:hypothetical protein
MKCENCGNELSANAIICRACNHNNARSAVSQWRARRTGELEPPPSRQITPRTSEPRIVPRKDTKEIDDNLLRFPASSRPAPGFKTAPAQSAEAAAMPAWREQVKEKVRLARERRHAEEEPDVPVSEPPLEKNPIVESALKRIRRTPQVLAVPVRGPGPTAQVALWQADETDEDTFDTPSQPQPPIAPRAEERLRTRPAPLAHPPAAPVAERPAPDAPPAQPKVILPKINPFAPTPKPDAPPAAKPATVTLTPRTRPAGSSGSLGGNSGPRGSTPTEIIEMTHAVNRMAPPQAKPATLWLRTLAGACDFEVIATAYLPLFGAFATLDTTYGVESLFVMAVLLAACAFAYQVVTLLIAGRSFGMAMLRLRLVNTDDDQLPVTRRQKMLRAWAATIAFFCPPLNLLITRLNYPQRSLPDLISGTTIVSSRKPRAPGP